MSKQDETCTFIPFFDTHPLSRVALLDIDECEEYGICPQGCKNTKGSYDCECAPGYRKVGNGHMCEADGESSNTFSLDGLQNYFILLVYL